MADVHHLTRARPVRFFILVLPVMRAVRAIAVAWRRTPWAPWQPLPVWTKP